MSEVMARVDGAGKEAMRAARATVSSRTVPGSHTCSARPRSTSSSAPTQSEVSRTRAARCQPIAAGNRKLLAASGGTPSSEKGTRSRAPRSTSTRSQCGEHGEAQPDGHPVHGREERYGDVAQRLEQAHGSPDRTLDCGAGGDGGHFGQVRARGEGAAAAGQDHGADRLVGVGVAQRRRQLEVHGGVEGVAHLGRLKTRTRTPGAAFSV